ncbi:ATP-binding protein [Streptomyces boncukensis]|uniref:ATPase n=1 Tax=Streptomyces boncukensis TaxID=2711219 RepID=A0A6G4WV39_9ACTN|nr:hypothetical protein [Streptomyces boncukensis]NGO69085.1 hypothetical protein [Streptomyces boncukensis]
MSASVHDGRIGNLPAETDAFVGRREELTRMDELLGVARLVTLTGPGGVGKSRLALHAAALAKPRFPGGVWLVELSPLTDPALVVNSVAQTLRLAEQTVVPATEALAEQLRGARVLIVLDTCEHLLDACAPLATELLEAVPELTVMATSRQPLGAPGEHVLVLDPLPVGPEEDAVALFAARAAAAVPSFRLTEENRADVTAVCAHLDGIPLALELAAIRLRGIPLPRLLERLDCRFDLLTGHAAARQARHRTLRTAIGWSHELCTPLERLLWARLSVFADGWDVEAAEFVCHGGPLAAERILEVLAWLAEKSIVQQVDTAGGVRFRMLDTLREFGAQWLAELGEADETCRRHRDYYRWLARQGEAEWLGPGQRTWAERMTTEHANLRLALEACLSAPDPGLAVELAGTLWFFWFGCGRADEGRAFLERAMRRAPSAPAPGGGPAWARAHWVRHLLTLTSEDLDAAEEVTAAYARLTAARGVPAPAAVLPLTGASLAVRGESARSAVLAPGGEGQAGGGPGADFLPLLTLAVEAYLLTSQAAFTRAARVAERLRTACERRGELWMRAWGDYFLALAALGHGDVPTASAHARAALAAKWRVHDALGTAATLELAVATEAAARRPERAAQLLGAVTTLWHTAGLPRLGQSAHSYFPEAYERRLRDVLGNPLFDRCAEHGRQLPAEDAVSLALTAP